MTPAHPKLGPAVQVTEEDLNDPKELARIERSVKQFLKDFNRGVRESEARRKANALKR